MTRHIFICIAALALVASRVPAVGGVEHRDTASAAFPAPATVHSCGDAAAVNPAAVPVTPLTTGPLLTIEVRDAASHLPIAARVGVWSSGVAVAPPDPEAALFQFVSGRSHFYCDGQAALVVPPGEVTVKAGCGFEYVPVETTLVVSDDGDVVIDLVRLVDMNAAGWYAADTHAHISHPPVIYNVQPENVITVMEAEGLNVVNSMEEEPYFTGELHPASTPQRLLYFSKEERNAHFGHLSLVGLKQWIPDQTCHLLDHVCGRTLTRHISDAVHAQDPHTMVIATHPVSDYRLSNIEPWPGGGIWRGMSIDLLGGHVDAMDILNYTNATPQAAIADYFHALNLGFRLPPSAGSDAVLGMGSSLPVGGYRVYAQLDGAPLQFDTWVDAMRGGRTFVSNYPLITSFSVGGQGPGGDVDYTGAPLPAQISVACARPFAKIEIIAGGAVVYQLDVAPGTTRIEADFDVDPAGAGWIVARVTGASGGWHVVDAGGLFAQTAPVYVVNTGGAVPMSVAGLNPLEVASYRFREFTEEVVGVFQVAEFTPQGRAEFDSMTAFAIDYYKSAWPDPPDHFDLVSPLAASWFHGRPWIQTLTPTFRWRRATDPDPGDTVTYEFQLDTDYAFDDPVVTTGIADTSFTVPLEYGLEDQETYYWRVFAVDALGNRRVATPGWWTFVIDMLVVDAGDDGPPRTWALRTVYPNPFNPALRVSYTVPAGSAAHRLTVYDARGRHVRTLFDGTRPPGLYEEAWDGRDRAGAEAASGVYFVRLSPAGSSAVTRKVVLLK